jgi:hypothetical protein
MPTIGSTGHAGQGLGPLDGEDLDLHAALLAGHRQVGAVGAVEQHREVVLLLDLGAAAIITFWTVFGPLMSIPRIGAPSSAASSIDLATLTPPACHVLRP